jgi:peroxiredoxin
MAGSIRAKGLLQNPIARLAGDEIHSLEGGERRHEALVLLAARTLADGRSTADVSSRFSVTEAFGCLRIKLGVSRGLERSMILFVCVLLSCFLAGMPSLAWAELAVGTAAPAFLTEAAQGGRERTFTLSEVLTEGPVVVYFYPKSFTSVCTEEAHLFAEAMAEFETLGSSVIGISADTIETQREFSRTACRDKFPVAADPQGDIVKAYDVLGWKQGNSIFASRTSYVITPDGKIASVLTAADAGSHIQSALTFVKSWRARHVR